MGTGAIGLFLTKILTDNKHDIFNYDSRKKLKSTQFKLNINNKLSTLDIQPTINLGNEDDLIIVTTKTYNIDDAIVSYLLKSKKEIIFLQNGIVLRSILGNMSNKFSFGTLTGIQAYLENSNLTVTSDQCKVLVKNSQDYSSVAKLQSPINPLCEFVLSGNIDNLILSKFTRWLIVSILTSLTSRNLGDSLYLIPSKDIRGGIDEILEFINLKFDLEIDGEAVYNSILKLPKELRTSSFRDYMNRKENEMIIELDYLLKYTGEKNFKPIILSQWSKDLSKKN